ncbi:MAG: hypothetical protein B7X95_01745 [Methylophilaceae bacterium 17-44-8]|jgi:hypothetical protein|nr:MAG: hypothetical protein B7Y48_06170 [Methylophilales bacterium 28-44-11]OYZ03522.1 MAG: hypothetical protein B7Y32_04805 [Methylophilales bacterium 16-45-7]OZA06660.1 MAG: hypothetical protein B7X95_01745 [Methylophilaceae bacterium 17-44-8]
MATAKKDPSDKVATKKTATKAAAAKPATEAKAKAATKKSSKSKSGETTLAERYRMVEVAAYYIAEQNQFAGSPTDYWIQAEIDINAKYPK